MAKKLSNRSNKVGRHIIYPANVGLAIKKAVNFHKLNQFPQAAAIYEDILSSYPAHPQANHLYGLILFDRKNYKGAIAHIKKAIKFEPNNAEYLHNLGIVCKDAGNLLEAKKMLRLSLKKNPNYYSAYNSLGSIYMLEQKYKEAKKLFRRAIQFDPKYFDAIYNLAQAFMSLKEYECAEEQLIILNDQSADNPEVNKALYKCYMDSGNLESASRLILSTLEKDPDNALMNYKLSQIYEKQSKLDKAEAYISKSCDIDSKNIKYKYLRAVIFRRLNKIQSAAQALENIEMPTGNPVLDQNIYFELGRLCDKMGDYESSIKNYTLANQTQAENVDTRLIRKERFTGHIDKVKQNLSKEWVASWNTCNQIPDDNLVFMVAFPRSGTTLLDQLLDGHSNIQVMEEVPILGNVISQLVSKGLKYPEYIEKLGCKEITKYREYYFTETEKYIKLQEGALLIDKLPLNIVEIQLIHRLFPSAKIILSLRHPYDVCLSNFMQHFDLNDAMANFLTLKDTAITYQKVMQLWQEYTKVLPISYHTIRYEDLVEDTEVQAKILVDFLGIEWESGMLNHVEHAKTRKLNTPSYQQVTQPIYNSSCYRWKNYSPYLREISGDLNDLIEYFGYSA